MRIQPLFDGTAAEIEAAVTEGLTAIVPPKVATPDEVRRLHDLLSYAEGRAGIAHGSVGLLPLPETAQGMYDAYHLAKASPRVRGIHGAISGPVAGDFARAFGFRATSGGEEQLYLASKLVLDSRAAGAMHPMAGIFGTAQDDLPAVERLIRKARDIGYSGVAVDASDPCRDRQRRLSPDGGGSRLLQRVAGSVRGGGKSRVWARSVTRARWSIMLCCPWRRRSSRRPRGTDRVATSYRVRTPETHASRRHQHRRRHPTEIRLADYAPPAFLIDTVDLSFELDEAATRVVSRLALRRNPAAPAGAPLHLDGEALTLVRLPRDGARWQPANTTKRSWRA